jgi:RNA polymerase-binding transcription factor DksA
LFFNKKKIENFSKHFSLVFSSQEISPEKESPIKRLRTRYESQIQELNEKLSQALNREKLLKNRIKKYEEIQEINHSLINTRNRCFVCGLSAAEEYYCCFEGSYCSFDCKVNDWKTHYFNCKKNIL